MAFSANKPVLIFAGGGLGPRSGGVGTLLRYLLAEWARHPASLPARVIDTRGQGGALSGAIHFARALASLIAARLAGRVACAHIHMTTRGSALRKMLLCLLARALGVPVILHLHGADFFAFFARLPKSARFALRAVLAKIDTIVVIGNEWRDRLVREVGLPAARLRVIPNGVPAAAQRRPSAGPVHLLFLGRLGARKGVADLIGALATPDLRARAWSATIAGDGDAAPFLAQIERVGLSDRIAMPGWLGENQAAAALEAADILVLPSHHEVMPIAILEAMARGLAIVATPVGAIPEILQDGVNAWLIPPGEPAQLAASLAALIDDPARRQALGRAARETFARRLDIAIPAAALQALYAQHAQREVPARQACPVQA